MESCDLKNIMEKVFKHAYQSGKQDMLEGIHICSDVLFEQFIESNVLSSESQLSFLKSSISESDIVEINSSVESENLN